MTKTMTCPVCQGSGIFYAQAEGRAKTCHVCNGNGFTEICESCGDEPKVQAKTETAQKK